MDSDILELVVQSLMQSHWAELREMDSGEGRARESAMGEPGHALGVGGRNRTGSFLL